MHDDDDEGAASTRAWIQIGESAQNLLFRLTLIRLCSLTPWFPSQGFTPSLFSSPLPRLNTHTLAPVPQHDRSGDTTAYQTNALASIVCVG
ncbi:hypothetical protein NMY22_g18761 [Coprinellus aureogranulatus]|nr:hypothetical protein NMY22_g18761 [Coprinellus aureogranulatus]